MTGVRYSGWWLDLLAGFGLVLMAVVTPSMALAGTPVEEERALAMDGRLRLSNPAGKVRVEVWDRAAVSVSGTLGEGVDQLRIEGDAHMLDMKVVSLDRDVRRDLGPTDLLVRVPRSARLDLDTASADIRVDGLQGALVAQSVSGDIELSITSPSVTVASVSGDVRLDAASSDTRITTVSGDIDASGPAGRLYLETVSGNVALAGGQFDRVDLKTISGDMRVDFSLAHDAQVIGESLSGNLVLHLPQDASAWLRATSFSGDIESGFGGSVETGQRQRGYEMRVNDGSARIELASFSGDIEVMPR